MKKKQQKWRLISKIILLVILILVALCAISLARSKWGLTCSEYEIDSAKITSDGATETATEPMAEAAAQPAAIRIVELADLHNAVFGENNSRLVDMVKAQNPDLILMVGDMVQEGEEDLTVITNLIRDLSDTAPIYYSIGNHEEAYIRNYVKAETADAMVSKHDLLREIESAGATVLDREYEDITIKGTDIRLGGIYGYCVPATDEIRKEFANQPIRTEEMEWVLDFQDTDRLKLLMCHMPVCWIQNGSLEYYDVDVVFSGHAHGGQVRLPLIGGLYAPDQGWFPGREAGLYFEKQADTPSILVLSRGLGSEMAIPRFCNTPEVVTLEIRPNK